MNIKNWFPTLLAAGVVASGLSLSSCEDEFTEADAIAAQDSTLTALKRLENENAVALDALNHEQEMAFQMYQDSLERIGPVVNYTVTVIAGGSANTNARTTSENFAEGATITLAQGGVSHTETTSSGGVATFSDLRIGEAVITVEAEDHTSVTYTTTLGTSNFEIQEDNVETTIPIFPLTVEKGASEVSGVAWAELDLTNDEPEFAEGAIVRATVSVSNALNAYGVPFGSSNKGEIRTASYSDFVQTATVGADGRYTLIVPNGNADNGNGIPADVEFLPYEAQQTYAAIQGDSVAVVTKSVIFGSDAGDGDHVESDIPSMYIEIGAPTGSASGFALTAVAERQSISEDSYYELDNKGTGYTVGDKFNFSNDEDDVAAYIEVTTVNADGVITGWNLVDNGAEYTTAPSLSQDAGASGTGASFAFIFMTDYDIEMTGEGTGYWDEPQVNIEYSWEEDGLVTKYADTDWSPGLDLVAGKLKDDYGDETDNIVDRVSNSATVPVITILPLEKRQAIVDFNEFIATEDGEFSFWDDDDDSYEEYWSPEEGGAGYVTAPTVTIKTIGESMGSGAAVTAYVSNGEIDELILTNPGSGYNFNVNKMEAPDAETVSQLEDGTTFKPASSNPNFNFYYSIGAVKQ